MALEPCDEPHCHSEEVKQACIEIYGPDYGNKPVVGRKPNGQPCKCVCSCMAFDTQVAISATATKAIQDFKAKTGTSLGDTVYAAGANLQWSQKDVVFSGGTNRGTKQSNAVFVGFGDDEFIVTTGDHMFLMPGGKLRLASKLVVGDKLVRPDGTPVAITGVLRGDFYSGFHHIATSFDDPKGNLDGHLLATAGVVSADFTVQLYKDEFLDYAEKSLPEAGSIAYEKKHGAPAPIAPITRLAGGKVALGRPGIAPLGLAAFGQPVAPALVQPLFIPGHEMKIKIPADAARFISDAEAQAKAFDPMRSLDDPTSLDEANSIVFHTRAYDPYSSVTYHVDWYDNTVNAFAWVENGVRHVALKGGLLRHTAIHYQAVALVLAHELGHHFGGQPTFPGGLSCEGRADYYGANIAMRKVWFGEFYIQMMTAAISQLQNFFSPNPGNHGCNHPSRDCRMSIYNAAVDLNPIPACAFAT